VSDKRVNGATEERAGLAPSLADFHEPMSSLESGTKDNFDSGSCLGYFENSTAREIRPIVGKGSNPGLHAGHGSRNGQGSRQLAPVWSEACAAFRGLGTMCCSHGLQVEILC
jgi:hypothetical protein